ncbi:hypothetical protein Mc24_08389 [Thermotoga sp. Mc24]|nr:hypothetical protein Mc24_08389 [Thermotoga sp. Mc24]
MIFDFLNDFNIRLPIPAIVLNFMIDNLVDFLNQTLWKKQTA